MKEALDVQCFLNEQEDGLYFYSLGGLLPLGQSLSVNTTHLIISLVARNAANGNPILLEKTLAEPQMRLLLTLLEAPHYSPHEVLLASLFCSYQGLLAGLFSSNRLAREEWVATVEQRHVRMERARELGAWKRELKQLYNALSKLRPKLRPFGLDIAVCISGSAYTLISLPVPAQRSKVQLSVEKSSLKYRRCSPEVGGL